MRYNLGTLVNVTFEGNVTVVDLGYIVNPLYHWVESSELAEIHAEPEALVTGGWTVLLVTAFVMIVSISYVMDVAALAVETPVTDTFPDAVRLFFISVAPVSRNIRLTVRTPLTTQWPKLEMQL